MAAPKETPPLAPLDYALRLAAKGVPCFPCRADKRPACANGFKDATCDHERLHQLFAHPEATLVGVATGTASGFDVLDLDLGRHPEAAQWWDSIKDRMPPTRRHQTGSGDGIHLLFKHKEGIKNWTARPRLGVDGRGDGGYVIWRPAAEREILNQAAFAEWPDWLLAQVARPESAPSPKPNGNGHWAGDPSIYRYCRVALDNQRQKVATGPNGSRNQELNNAALALGHLAQ
jgi:hypothetical protein